MGLLNIGAHLPALSSSGGNESDRRGVTGSGAGRAQDDRPASPSAHDNMPTRSRITNRRDIGRVSLESMSPNCVVRTDRPEPCRR